mmetsp:Transcript_546/g.1408  ORF Transcript_546/g.1408 Transcript_546/m.1408 type:complete len:179 (-) Transcript_546:489-1025(-)
MMAEGLPPLRDGIRKSGRSRKVSKAMAVVGVEERRQAAQARLDALERDNVEEETVFGANTDDEEFMLEGSSDEEGRPQKRKKKGKKGKTAAARKTRRQQDRPTTFAGLLEEVTVGPGQEGRPDYVSAAAGPPQSTAPRKFCSVCGFTAPYTCTRCGSRFCCKKCQTTHAETRCLKFTM